MNLVEKTLRQIIAFSKMQRAAQIRRLKAEDKAANTVQVDAYSQVIGTLSSILNKENEALASSEEE